MPKISSSELSPREIELVQLVATGATNQQIASELNISINTVKAHLRNIYAKLEVESRTEASMVAIHRGLIDMGQGEPDEPELASDQPADEPVEEPPLWRSPWAQRLALIAVVVIVALVAAWPRARISSQTAGSDLLDVTHDPQLVAAPEELDRWEPRAQLPTPRGRFALATVDGTLYAISGMTPQGWTGRVEAYDPADDIWSRVAAKPIPVANVSAAVLDGKIVVPGGLLEDGSLTDAVEVYDPAGDAWSIGPDLPEPRCAYALAEVGGALYLFGGWDGDQYVDSVLQLDPDAKKWQAIATMPAPSGFSAATVVGDKVFVLGGVNDETVLSTCLSFAPERVLAGENPWRTHSPMRTPRAGHAVAVVDDRIYVLGGGWGRDVEANESYDTGDDTWSNFASPLAGQWRTLGATAIASPGGDLIVTVGGWQGQYLGLVETYQATFRVFLP